MQLFSILSRLATEVAEAFFDDFFFFFTNLASLEIVSNKYFRFIYCNVLLFYL